MADSRGARGGGDVTSGASGRVAYAPPSRAGRFPWRWRWAGVALLLLAAVLSGWWAWGRMENHLDENARVHLACEGIDADSLDLDWSYRSVDVTGRLPVGVTADRVEQIIERGSTDTTCLARSGIDADDDPGVADVDVARLVAAPAPAATATPEPEPTAEPVADPTATAVPQPTPTPMPEPTATPLPEPTATPVPEPTVTPEPVAALDVTASFDQQTVTLTGTVATDAQRDLLIAAAEAAVGADNVIDQLSVDSGVPSSTADLVVAQLASLIGGFGSTIVEGSATATDDGLTYELVLTDPTAADDLPGSGTFEILRPTQPEFTG